MEFNIGDKVICVRGIKSPSGDINVVEGQHYIIRGIDMCVCGSISVDVGLLAKCGTICPDCAFIERSGRWWLMTDRFIKEGNHTKEEAADVSGFMELFTTTEKKVDID